MLGAFSRDYGNLGPRNTLNQSLLGAILGSALTVMNMIGYGLVMERYESSIDFLTVEAWEMSVNYPLLLLFVGISMLILLMLKRRFELSSFFYLFFVTMYIVAGWYYVIPSMIIAALRIKYLID